MRLAHSVTEHWVITASAQGTYQKVHLSSSLLKKRLRQADNA